MTSFVTISVGSLCERRMVVGPSACVPPGWMLSLMMPISLKCSSGVAMTQISLAAWTAMIRSDGLSARSVLAIASAVPAGTEYFLSSGLSVLRRGSLPLSILLDDLLGRAIFSAAR